MAKCQAKYEVHTIVREINNKTVRYLIITDLNTGKKSVTNDLENVFKDVFSFITEPSGLKIIYRDSEKRYDGIVIEKGIITIVLLNEKYRYKAMVAMEKYYKENEKYFWLSFCDGRKEGGKRFQGVIVTTALNQRDAIDNVSNLGINPPGSIKIFELPKTIANQIKSTDLNRLLSEKYLIESDIGEPDISDKKNE